MPQRFGSNVQVLDWALHMDEATPHIHERHGIYVIANHESTENDAYHWKKVEKENLESVLYLENCLEIICIPVVYRK